MNIWGITGTNGKTTTTWIFAEFLRTAGRKCGYLTTVEVDDGKDRYYTGYTTPPFKQLKEIFARMEANGCTDCVMEVSSHAIHQRRTGDTIFAGGAFTNLSEDHLDYHKTMEEYFRVKLSFAEQIAREKTTAEDAPYVVCMDGGYAEEMLEKCRGIPGLFVKPVSFRESAYDLSALQLVGDYNKSNTLVAAALAEAAGVPHDVIQTTIPRLAPRWGRLERVHNPNVPAEVYVDFAHTPDGLEKVLTAMRGVLNSSIRRFVDSSNPQTIESKNRRIDELRNSLWVVFGAGGDRDPMKRPLMGEVAARLADHVIVTSDNPRSENPDSIISQIVAGIPRISSLNSSLLSLTTEPDRRKAIELALREAKEGDIVVIAGKGHETTQEIAGVKYPFDDREIVRSFHPADISARAS